MNVHGPVARHTVRQHGARPVSWVFGALAHNPASSLRSRAELRGQPATEPGYAVRTAAKPVIGASTATIGSYQNVGWPRRQRCRVESPRDRMNTFHRQ